MKNTLLMVLIFLLLAGCGANAVPTEEKYLYHEIFGDNVSGDKTLVVFLHGDSGRDGTPGRASRYMFNEAKRLVDRYPEKAFAISLLRPGYHDDNGNRSPGRPDPKDDDKTAKKNSAVARTVEHLKEIYAAKRVIGVGHSGGAMMLGVIIGQSSDLFDAVVLVSMACDIPSFRRYRSGRNTWTKSQSPNKFVDTVSPAIVIRTISGAKDNITLPSQAKTCVKAWEKRGIDAKAITVPDAGHGLGRLRDSLDSQLKELL